VDPEKDLLEGAVLNERLVGDRRGRGTDRGVKGEVGELWDEKTDLLKHARQH
jgi:hypothetical protein